jgi:hypothetical protein
MSHTSTVKSIKIQSIPALRSAIDELARMGIQCSLVEKATPRAYFPNQEGMGQADYVIRLEQSPYDIGLYKTDTGYEARTDFFGGSIERALGVKPTSKESTEQARMGKLFQMYGVHAATEAARMKGHMVQRITKPNGVIALEISGPGL